MKKWPDKMPKLLLMLPADGWCVKYESAPGVPKYPHSESLVAWGLTTGEDMIGVTKTDDGKGGFDYAERQHPLKPVYFRK